MRQLSMGGRTGRVVLVAGVAAIALAALGAALSPSWEPHQLPRDLRYDSLPPIPGVAYASGTASADIERQDVRIPVSGATLDATVLVPDEPESKPGLVFVQGAGQRARADVVERAEYFARSGIVTLVCDKRKTGYSTATNRDFGLLAGDTLAAVEVLRAREDVDPTRVGLWGISEGAGWVIPTAAARAPDRVAFAVLVSAPTMSPALEMGWWADKGLRQLGAPEGMRRATALALSSGRAGTFGAFDYVTFDPLPAMQRISQPVLALYGTSDRTIPIAQATRQLTGALESNGNDSYTVLLFDGADHGLRVDDGGFARGYQQVMVEWIHRLPDIAKSWSGQVLGTPPDQRYAMADMPATPRYATFVGQISILSTAMLGYLAGPLARGVLRRRRATGRDSSDKANPWMPVGRLLRRAARSAIAVHLVLPLCLAGSMALALAAVDLTVVVNGAWLLVRLLALASLVTATAAAERVVSEMRAGWRPGGVQAISLAGWLVGTALLLVLGAYWGLFAPVW